MRSAESYAPISSSEIALTSGQIDEIRVDSIPEIDQDVESESESNKERDALAKEKKERLKQNTKILLITTIAFTLFVIAEIIGALVSNSISLLGDAMAMSVDVVTYLSNIYAERVKSKSVDGKSLDLQAQIVIDVIVPIFSAFALIGISIYVLSTAFDTLSNFDRNEEVGRVKIEFLYGFATANMGIDLLSMFMFYTRGWSTFQDLHSQDDEGVGDEKEEESESDTLKNAQSRDASDVAAINELKDNIDEGNSLVAQTSKTSKQSSRKLEKDTAASNQITKKEKEKKKNVNMLSALVHVGCDTLRTLSVFIAAIVSSSTDIPGTLCDAWAAIIVTLTIFVMLIPLLIEIVRSVTRITKIYELKLLNDKKGEFSNNEQK
jgi:Co/Zn/Cd efflux system component